MPYDKISDLRHAGISSQCFIVWNKNRYESHLKTFHTKAGVKLFRKFRSLFNTMRRSGDEWLSSVRCRIRNYLSPICRRQEFTGREKSPIAHWSKKLMKTGSFVQEADNNELNCILILLNRMLPLNSAKTRIRKDRLFFVPDPQLCRHQISIGCFVL